MRIDFDSQCIVTTNSPATKEVGFMYVDEDGDKHAWFMPCEKAKELAHAIESGLKDNIEPQRHDLLNEASLKAVAKGECPSCNNGHSWDIRKERIRIQHKDGVITYKEGDYEIDIYQVHLNIPCKCDDCEASYTLRYRLEDGIWHEKE